MLEGMVPPEPDAGPSGACFALVSQPQFRHGRRRFAAGCVTVVESREAALAACREDDKRFPALVVGPSKSSEGQFIYYLVEWLHEPA